MMEARRLRRSDGTLSTQRERLPWPRDRRFRILSIDGGGIRGVLPASVLARLEARHCGGEGIGGHFDMIAGTSTGGIIALALAMGLPASKILDLYVHHGHEIFPTPRRLRRIRSAISAVTSLRNYRYDREPLERELRKVFGHAILGDTSRRLCVPSFDGFTEVNVFKTPHHPDFRLDWREELVTIALATSAAPTFFSVYANGDRRFADGGVWANNPVMVALVDALTCYDIDRDQIDILSLGCGESEMIFTDRQVRLGGLWHWRGIMSSAMHLASQNAMGQAGLLIGRDRIVRLDAPPMPDSPIALDDVARAVEELPPIAAQLVDRTDAIIANRFLASAADPYMAYHGPRAEATLGEAMEGAEVHPRDQIVSFAAFDASIEKMMALLASVEMVPSSGSRIVQQHQQAFAALYHSVYSDLRSSVSRKDEFRLGASLAGLGDLAAKIIAAAAAPGGLAVIEPHLRNMISGSAQMNSASPSIDAAANKHSELYVAALALNAGFQVDLEDPEASAGGANPDLLLSDATGEWSIAVKALHSSKAPSIFANLRKAASQITVAGRPGIIFVNAKNVVDHDGLQAASPFASVDLATGAVARELTAIADRLRSEIALEDWDEAFSGGTASRVIALTAQITVSADFFPFGPMFVPVKVMKILYGLPLAEDPAALTGVDQAARWVLERLNEQLQRNL